MNAVRINPGGVFVVCCFPLPSLLFLSPSLVDGGIFLDYSITGP